MTILPQDQQRLLSVGLACNDWRNGQPRGLFDSLNITGAGDYIEIECAETAISTLTEVSPKGEKRLLRVGRVKVPYLSYRMWVGNWCWDEVTLTVRDCAIVLDYLYRKRDARCISGPTGFFENFNGEHEVTQQEIENELSKV